MHPACLYLFKLCHVALTAPLQEAFEKCEQINQVQLSWCCIRLPAQLPHHL